MTLPEMLKIINEAYDEDELVSAYARDPNTNHGDGLAEFLVKETEDVFEPGLKNSEQLVRVQSAVSRAACQLLNVAAALSHRFIEELAAEKAAERGYDA
jgi:hypothetical protein